MKLIVTATETGYYDLARRRAGDKFVLTDESQFSWKWMVPEGWTPKAQKPKDWIDPRKRQEKMIEDFKAVNKKGGRKSAVPNHDEKTTEYVIRDSVI